MEENKENAKEFKVKKQEKKKETIGVKFLKILFILIGIFAVAYVMIVIRNTIIFNQILQKNAQYDNVTNYSYTTSHYEDNSKVDTETKTYRKDDIVKVYHKWNNNNLIMWKDSKNNEGLAIAPEYKKIVIDDPDNLVIGYMPEIQSFYTEKEYRKIAILMSIMYSEKVNGEDCYVINQGNSKEWISKETGLIMKRQDGYVQRENEKKRNSYIEYTDWRINEITDEEVAKPDLTGYTKVVP
ncbi:MAG: hypothetical protein HFJ28_07390 [Clostridia bacterium]|nr:hypothetical protein [Clostridia bacterium]